MNIWEILFVLKIFNLVEMPWFFIPLAYFISRLLDYFLTPLGIGLLVWVKSHFK